MDNEDIVDLGSDEDIVNDFVMETSPIIRENIKKYFIREIKDKYISENAIDMEIANALERLLNTLRIE